MPPRKELTVLLVEDDDVDVMAVKRGFAKNRIANDLHVAHDTQSAMEILQGSGGTPPLQRPYVILLDLNLPGMGGLEFLEILRKEPNLQDVVVFILSTSDHDADKKKAFDLGVAGYILKSDPAGGFLDAMSLIGHYWRIVELP